MTGGRDAAYDDAGRLLTQTLNPGLAPIVVGRTYYAWDAPNGQGRLQRVSAGGLLDFSYTYDPVGNIQTLQDAVNANQKQCFTYDALNRLKKATTFDDPQNACTTSIGEGNYSQAFEYEGNGNIQSTERGAYAYTWQASNCSTNQGIKPHAVSSIIGDDAGSYTYRCNGLSRR